MHPKCAKRWNKRRKGAKLFQCFSVSAFSSGFFLFSYFSFQHFSFQLFLPNASGISESILSAGCGTDRCHAGGIGGRLAARRSSSECIVRSRGVCGEDSRRQDARRKTRRRLERRTFNIEHRTSNARRLRIRAKARYAVGGGVNVG